MWGWFLVNLNDKEGFPRPRFPRCVAPVVQYQGKPSSRSASDPTAAVPQPPGNNIVALA
jgi:hypothetical protein